MTTVYWSQTTSVDNPNLPFDKYNLLKIEKLLPEIVNNDSRKYIKSGEQFSAFHKCPAFSDYMKNVYVIKSPFDICFDINEFGAVSSISGASESIQKLVMFRTQPEKNSNILLSLGLRLICYSDEDVLIEQLPPFMSYELMQQSATIIPGVFNIGKWVRPLEFAIEIKAGANKLQIKKGDALCYLRFVAGSKKQVKLIEKKPSKILEEVSNACVTLKQISPNLSLEHCYEMAKSFVSKFVRGKCPFR